MNDEVKIEKLRRITKQQIIWYEKNKANEDLVYDEMWNEFSRLSRGDYVEIIKILVSPTSRVLVKTTLENNPILRDLRECYINEE